MRLPFLCLVCLLAGCAAPAETARPVYEDRVRQGQAEAADARADSLLALPPGAMTPEDVAWIDLYLRAREQRAGEGTRRDVAQASRRNSETVTLLVSIAAVSAIVGIIFLLQSPDNVR